MDGIKRGKERTPPGDTIRTRGVGLKFLTACYYAMPCPCPCPCHARGLGERNRGGGGEKEGRKRRDKRTGGQQLLTLLTYSRVLTAITAL